MASLQFGTSSYERARGDMPALPVVNMIAEAAPTEQTGVALQSRAGLVDQAINMGAGPVRSLFRVDGFASGSLIGVSGLSLYKDTTLVGAINGSGPVSIAGHAAGLGITAGATPYYYDGTTLSAISFPDDADVTRIVAGASRLIFLRKDTGQFYWTPVLGSTVDALDFATAESTNDNLLDAAFVDDKLILAGSRSIEIWPNTTDADLPFQPLEGLTIEKGVKSTGSLTPLGESFAFVTNENRVCFGTETNVVSNPGLDARIADSLSCAAFKFLHDGAELLAVRLDNETQVWNPATGLWSEFASYGENNWLPRCYTDGVFGSAGDGSILAFGSVSTDIDGPMERRFRAAAALNSGGRVIDNIRLRCNVGQTPYLTGDYTDPVVEMRLSRDAGKTWGIRIPRTLGAQGEYRTVVTWRGCGMASQPGLMAEFRVTDPVDWRVSDVLYNEPYGGR